jgi:hypothetical protein
VYNRSVECFAQHVTNTRETCKHVNSVQAPVKGKRRRATEEEKCEDEFECEETDDAVETTCERMLDRLAPERKARVRKVLAAQFHDGFKVMTMCSGSELQKCTAPSLLLLSQ